MKSTLVMLNNGLHLPPATCALILPDYNQDMFRTGIILGICFMLAGVPVKVSGVITYVFYR